MRLSYIVLQLDEKISLHLFKIPSQGVKADDVMAKAIRDVIAPSALAERKRVVQRSNSLASQCSGEDAVQMTEENIRIIWSFDGERKFLDAMLDALVDNVPEYLKDKNFEIMKFAAAASKTQQPLDVSTSFRTIKLLTKGLRCNGTAHYTQALLSNFLKGMDASSLKTYVLFLSNLPEMLNKAFTTSAIKQGWATSGLVPLDAGRILSRCSTWSQLSREQGDAIIGSIPALMKHAQKTGEVDEDLMQRLVGDTINFDEWLAQHSGIPKKKGMPLARQALNRHRAVWLNHEATTKRRADAEARKEQAAQDRVDQKLKIEAERKRKAEEKVAAQLAKRKRIEDARALREHGAAARVAALAKRLQQKVRNAARKSGKAQNITIPPPAPPMPTSSGRVRKTPTKLA
jgi:hypothetical protein